MRVKRRHTRASTLPATGPNHVLLSLAFSENETSIKRKTARCEWLCSYAELYASHSKNQPLRASDQWEAYKCTTRTQYCLKLFMAS